MTRTLRHPNLPPAHPGALVAELIEDSNSNKSELAATLGVTRAALYNVIEERSAVSAEMAVRIEAAMGISADLLVAMQAAYDLHKARSARAGAVSARRMERIDVAPPRTRSGGELRVMGMAKRDAATGAFVPAKSVRKSPAAKPKK